MTLSRRRSVIATAGLIAASWLLSACSNQAAPETRPLGTGGIEPAAIGLETSNQSVTVTNNAGKPIVDVLISIQPVGFAPPGTTFSPRFHKARQVTVTATDIVGTKHEITKPWRP